MTPCPEPTSAEKKAREIVNALEEFYKAPHARKVQVLANALAEYEQKAYAKGFSEGAAAMRERAAKIIEEHHKYCQPPMCGVANKIRALPLNEAEGGTK